MPTKGQKALWREQLGRTKALARGAEEVAILLRRYYSNPNVSSRDAHRMLEAAYYFGIGTEVVVTSKPPSV